MLLGAAIFYSTLKMNANATLTSQTCINDHSDTTIYSMVCRVSPVFPVFFFLSQMATMLLFSLLSVSGIRTGCSDFFTVYRSTLRNVTEDQACITRTQAQNTTDAKKAVLFQCLAERWAGQTVCWYQSRGGLEHSTGSFSWTVLFKMSG